MNAKPEPCTNWYRTRQHLSIDLAPSKWHERGRVGLALCSGPNSGVDVKDQGCINALGKKYPHLRGVVVTDLPPCKRCARAAAKLQETGGPNPGLAAQ